MIDLLNGRECMHDGLRGRILEVYFPTTTMAPWATLMYDIGKFCSAPLRDVTLLEHEDLAVTKHLEAHVLLTDASRVYTRYRGFKLNHNNEDHIIEDVKYNPFTIDLTVRARNTTTKAMIDLHLTHEALLKWLKSSNPKPVTNGPGQVSQDPGS